VFGGQGTEVLSADGTKRTVGVPLQVGRPTYPLRLVRILSVISAYPPAMGGAQIHAHALNRALLERGNQVTVATTWRSTRRDWLRGTTVAAPDVRPAERLGGLTVENLGLSRAQRVRIAAPAVAYYAAMRSMAPRLSQAFSSQAEELIDRFRPDVAHLSRIGREWFYEAFVDALEERGIPYVVTPNHHPNWTRRRDWWWWQIYRRASRLLVLSDFEGSMLANEGVPQAHIIRTVVGPVGAPPGPVAEPGSEPQVLFLGQLRRYKRVDLLYAAMQSVWRHVPSCRLVVVGPWVNPQHRLRSLLERDPRVDVLGAVDEATKWRALADAHVVCVPSSDEALGGVYLESWVANRPVVGLAIPPVVELFERAGGGLAVERDPAALAGALRRLLEDRELARQLAHAGRAAVEREYNWDVAAARALTAYRAAMGG
jgi:glycogen synthase